jgi:hypothetical protein
MMDIFSLQYQSVRRIYVGILPLLLPDTNASCARYGPRVLQELEESSCRARSRRTPSPKGFLLMFSKIVRNKNIKHRSNFAKT